MATTKGKVTTTKSTFIKLAKGVRAGGSAALLAWCDVVDEYNTHDTETVSVRAFSQAYEVALKGSEYDEYEAKVIAVQMGHVIWANREIIGGARACKSINHIISQKRGDNKTKAKSQKGFDHKKESMRYSVAQLQKMLEYRLNAMG